MTADEHGGPEPPEGTPGARDGEPDANELERRRQERERGRSAADRAGDAEAPPEDDGQYTFEADEGQRKITLSTLIPRGVPVEYKVKTSGKSVTGDGALMDPAHETMSLAAMVLDEVRISFIRDDRGVVTKAKITQEMKPRAVVNARSKAAEQMLLEDTRPDAANA